MQVKYHIPVMHKEVMQYLNLAPGKTIIDATLGTGGHSLEILKHILPRGRLIGIDCDAESLSIAKERLSSFSSSCEFVHANFADIDRALCNLKIKKVDGIVFDLGLSSYQLQTPQRGFSFQNEGPLDMRMDRESQISAYDLVNNLDEEELSGLIRDFGQERWHNRIARFLVQERERRPITTTLELSNIVVKALPYKYRFYRIHPATRTFQAVRIAVNRELEILETALNKALNLLAPSARICVISFHSLEDRIVKWCLRRKAETGLIKILTPKPLTPDFEEVKENPLSRSAKFRAAEKGVINEVA